MSGQKINTNMEYFLLETAGDLNDERLCLITSPPEGMGINYYRLATGYRARKQFPNNAKVYLSPENRGIKLSDILGNLNSFFITSSLAKSVLEEYCEAKKIEYLPFTLFNHKNRVHSTDHFFVNPIGSFNCLKEDACNIKYSADGDIITIEEIVLDERKLRSAPHLFRIRKIPDEYVISKELSTAMRVAEVTNLVLKNVLIA